MIKSGSSTSHDERTSDGDEGGAVNRENTSPRIIVFALWLLIFSVASQAIIIAPILPRIAEQLAVPEALLGTLITSYAVMVGVFSLVTGPISDRYGRRDILLVGTALMTVSLALHGLASDFASLFAVRALAGVAGGILNGAAVAYVGDYFPRERRGWANGWVFSGFAAGAIAGIPLGTLLAEQFGFRWPFLAFAITVGVAFVLVLTMVPQPDVDRTDRLTVRSALGNYAELLGRRDVAAATVVFLIMFLANSMYIAFLPTWLETTLGATGGAIAGIFFFGGIASALAGPRAGQLSDRIGRKPLIVGASLAIAALMLVTSVVAINIWAVYVLFFLVMGLFASRGTPFQTLMTEMVASDRRGSFMSLTVGVGQFGNGFGGAVAGAAYATVGYPATTVIGAASMLVIAGLVWRYLPETVSEREPTVVTETYDSLVAVLHRQVPDAIYGPCHEAGHIDRESKRIGGPIDDDRDEDGSTACRSATKQ